MLKRSFYFISVLILSLVLFSCCKSNKDAFNNAYKRMKEKNEDTQLDLKAKTASKVSNEVMMNYKDTSAVHPPEVVNLVAGEPINFSDYSIVAKSFMNKTNARSFHGRMEDDGYPAVLIQNEELMYRIVIASFKTQEEARKKLDQVRTLFPEAWILIRK